MLMIKTLPVAIAAIATLSLNSYAAERQDNPLHPAYYAERVSTEFNVTPTQRYVDADNPLHAAFSFAKTTFNAAWIATGIANAKPYVDSRNPLHPSFNRF